MNTPTLKIIDNLADIPAADWDALAGGDPFLSYAYLYALQESGCATAQFGWQAQFITLWQDGLLLGALGVDGNEVRALLLSAALEYARDVVVQCSDGVSTSTLTLMEQLAIRLSPQAGKSLVIPLQGGGDGRVQEWGTYFPSPLEGEGLRERGW